MYTQKNYIDYGFGFAIQIDEVLIDEWHGEEFPLIDNDFLEYFALRELVFLPARLTGNQVRFIRHHFFETLDEFAQKAGVTHPAVIKWERSEDGPTHMEWGTEFLIRCRALTEVVIDSDEFGQLAATFSKPPQGIIPTLRISRACLDIFESEPISVAGIGADISEDGSPDWETCSFDEGRSYRGHILEEDSDAFANAA